jgi:hypothetical protein
MCLVSTRALILLSLLGACRFAVDPVATESEDAAVADLSSPSVDDLSRLPDLTVIPDAAPDLVCSQSCSGILCGQPNGCGTTCCAPGCTPVSCGVCQVADSCGSGCQTAPDNSSCALDMGTGFCNAGSCSPSAIEFSVFGTESVNNTIAVGTPLELGMKFTADRPFSVVRLRYYQDKPTGAHTGHLWDGSGTLLATAAFTTDTVTGWHEVTLPSPVPIAANTAYVVSYSTSVGFAWSGGYFNSAKDSPPLHAPVGAGTFATALNAFPTMTFMNSNYWVDVVVR